MAAAPTPELDGLLAAMVLGLGPADVPPPALRARTLAAVAAEAEAPAPAVPPRRRRYRLPRLRLASGLATAAAAGALLAVVLRGGAPGEHELDAQLRAPGADRAVATAEVRLLGIGREIHFHTDALPILPKGEFYELWFVGPRDRPGRPDRISAGTFDPDPEGVSDVRFTAAVDPARYPVLAVTAEPGDGDPAPSGPTCCALQDDR